MKILAVHNKYQLRGGEDECHDAKVRLLVSRGHDVREVIFDNSVIADGNRLALALSTCWNRHAYSRLTEAASDWRPDIIDIDNFFPLGSPSIHYAARSLNIPTVQTLHNYRLLCPGANLFRNGAVCEECIGRKAPWPGFVHRCYRDSIGASAAVTAMISVHNALGTWQSKVTLFVALTEFARRKFIEGGLPPERIAVKPNFVEKDAGPSAGDGGYALYAGRLSAEKGIHGLLHAWSRAGTGRLIIAGDGPLAPLVQRAAEASQNIEFDGRKPLSEIHELMGRARVLLFPSLCYEGLPGVVMESFCQGTPVIANRLGSMSELICDGETGWLVDPNNPDAFAAAIREALSEPARTRTMRIACRAAFQARYTAEANYGYSMDVYNRAISLNSHE
jgi:glycosyltransferase involved in cell wall biosynthesis